MSTNIKELTPPKDYPKTAQIDQGVTVGMSRVDLNNGRLSTESAVVEMDNSVVSLSPEELATIHRIYAKIYSGISLEALQQIIKLHRLAFLHPAYSLNPEDVNLTFEIKQMGRNNGFAINLNPSDPSSDREALTILLRDCTTNVPLGVGTGMNNGLYAYENPDFVLDTDGKVIGSGKTVLPTEARVLIIPGRIPKDIKKNPALPNPKLGGWGGFATTSSDTIHIDGLPKITLQDHERPPVPHLVAVRAATVLAPGSILANREKRVTMAQRLWANH